MRAANSWLLRGFAQVEGVEIRAWSVSIREGFRRV